MANNGRGKNEIKKETVGWDNTTHRNDAGVDNKDISGSLKEENQSAVGWASQPTDNAESVDNKNISGSLKENPTLDLPELNADNWHIIVQKLTPELGANVLLAQHTSLIKVENQEITLSVHKNGELFRKLAHLTALGEVLSHHYGTQKNIQLIEWQDNFENATQAKQRHKEEEQQQRLNELHLDPFAQKLQKTFGGEWVVK